MTKHQIMEGYLAQHGRQMRPGDYDAFIRMMERFNITAVSYQDAHAQISKKINEQFDVLEAGGMPGQYLN